MTEAIVLSFVLVLLRVASFVAFLPPFSSGGLPRTVKIGLALALTGVWGPLYGPDLYPQLVAAARGSHPELTLGWMAVRETLLGVGLAWVLGLLFVPMKVAGAYIAQEMGLTLANLSSPVDQQSSNVVSQFTEALGTLVFFAVDAHHLLFRVFASLWRAVPVGQPFSLPSREWVVGCVAGAEIAGLEIAAPVGAGLFLALVLLLFVIRTAPQFNLMTFGMQVRLLAGLVLLVLLVPEMIHRFVGTFNHLSHL
jgi:flagellar biosynthetic protein FliR